jgi:hypothetical protein
MPGLYLVLSPTPTLTRANLSHSAQCGVENRPAQERLDVGHMRRTHRCQLHLLIRCTDEGDAVPPGFCPTPSAAQAKDPLTPWRRFSM